MTTTTSVVMECQVTAPQSIEPDVFHAFALAVMDQLLQEERCCGDVADATVSSDAGQRVITIEMQASGQNSFDALITAATVARSALHKVGAATPGWPDADDLYRLTVNAEPTLIAA